MAHDMTEMEAAILSGIVVSEYQEGDGEEVVGFPIWTWNAIDGAGLSGAKARGVISSLVKKGWVDAESLTNADESTVAITAAGYQAFNARPAQVEPTPAPKAERKAFVSSLLIAALEKTWADIKAHHKDLPRAVLIVAPGLERGATPHWGYWHAGQWTVETGARVGEVKISGERLADGPEGVLETLLHEAAHALAHGRSIQDTSRQGRYHNKRFKKLAEEVGLSCERLGNIGWSHTALTPQVKETYKDALAELGKGIADSHRRHPGWIRSTGDDDAEEGQEDSGEEKKKSGRALYVCGCPEPRKLRMSASVFDLGAITCGVCGEAFGEVG